jgi:hypothetical protein
MAAARCSARRTTGDPCGNYPSAGARVCRYHGGNAPQVRAAAERRLVEAKLERGRVVARRKTDQLVSEERERRVALQPWAEELGPNYMWDWHSPPVLRRIATEMRRAAAELTQLASSTDERQAPQCTSS